MDGGLLQPNLATDAIHMPHMNMNMMNVNVGMQPIPLQHINETELSARTKAANRMRKFRHDKKGDKEWSQKEAER